MGCGPSHATPPPVLPSAPIKPPRRSGSDEHDNDAVLSPTRRLVARLERCSSVVISTVGAQVHLLAPASSDSVAKNVPLSQGAANPRNLGSPLQGYARLSLSKSQGTTALHVAPSRRRSLSLPENLHAERRKLSIGECTGQPSTTRAFNHPPPRSPPISSVINCPPPHRTRTVSSLRSLSEEEDLPADFGGSCATHLRVDGHNRLSRVLVVDTD